jgi:hypothetical protein
MQTRKVPPDPKGALACANAVTRKATAPSSPRRTTWSHPCRNRCTWGSCPCDRVLRTLCPSSRPPPAPSAQLGFSVRGSTLRRLQRSVVAREAVARADIVRNAPTPWLSHPHHRATHVRAVRNENGAVAEHCRAADAPPARTCRPSSRASPPPGHTWRTAGHTPAAPIHLGILVRHRRAVWRFPD